VSQIIIVCAAGAAFLSLCLSTVSLLVHYAKRGEHPQVTPIRADLDALRLAFADLVDRVEHWQKRDRARRVREQVDDSPPTPTGIPEVPNPLAEKQMLRAVARQRGIVR
jgi:hypothetical protein